MINANELRIGNYIITPIGNITIVTYHHIRLQTFADNNSTEFEGYNPIELTEEWLLRFGGQKRAIGGLLSFGLFSSKGDIIEVRYYSNGRWQIRIEGTIIAYLEHIHQLQNLYFALTGEELTLTASVNSGSEA